MGERVIGRNAATRRRGDDMKLAKPEKFHELLQIFRGDAGFGAVSRRRTKIAASRIGDDAITRLHEDRLLIAPDQAAARRRMQEHDGLARPACVPEPQPGISKLRNSLLGWRLWRYRDRRQRIGERLRGCGVAKSGSSGAKR